VGGKIEEKNKIGLLLALIVICNPIFAIVFRLRSSTLDHWSDFSIFLFDNLFLILSMLSALLLLKRSRRTWIGAGIILGLSLFANLYSEFPNFSHPEVLVSSGVVVLVLLLIFRFIQFPFTSRRESFLQGERTRKLYQSKVRVRGTDARFFDLSKSGCCLQVENFQDFKSGETVDLRWSNIKISAEIVAVRPQRLHMRFIQLTPDLINVICKIFDSTP
jgi:hypothetical protein